MTKRATRPGMAGHTHPGTTAAVDASPADVRATISTLLAARAPDATICPSEAARALATDWRSAMPAVHAAIDAMVADGTVRLRWKGAPLAKRDGPYRIARGAG